MQSYAVTSAVTPRGPGPSPALNSQPPDLATQGIRVSAASCHDMIDVEFVVDSRNLEDGTYWVGQFSRDYISNASTQFELTSLTHESPWEKRCRRPFAKWQFPLEFTLSHYDCRGAYVGEVRLKLKVESVSRHKGRIDLTPNCEEMWARPPPATTQNEAAVVEALRKIEEDNSEFKLHFSKEWIQERQAMRTTIEAVKQLALDFPTGFARLDKDIRSLQHQQALLKQNSDTADQSSRIGFLENEMTALRQEVQAHSKRDHGAYTEKEKALSMETKDWSKIQAENLDKLRADVQKDQLSLRTEMLAEVKRRIDAKMREVQIKPVAAKQGTALQGISRLIMKLQRDSDAQSERIQSLEDRLPDQEDLKEKNRALEGVMDAQLKVVRRYVQDEMKKLDGFKEDVLALQAWRCEASNEMTAAKMEQFEQALRETADTMKTLKDDLTTSLKEATPKIERLERALQDTSAKVDTFKAQQDDLLKASKCHTKGEIVQLMDAQATEVSALKEMAKMEHFEQAQKDGLSKSSKHRVQGDIVQLMAALATEVKTLKEKVEKVEHIEQVLQDTSATVNTLKAQTQKGDLSKASKYHTKDEIVQLMDAQAIEISALKEDIQKQLLPLQTEIENLKTSSESQFSELRSNLEEDFQTLKEHDDEITKLKTSEDARISRFTKLEDEIDKLKTSKEKRLSQFEDEIGNLKTAEEKRLSQFTKLKGEIKTLKTSEDERRSQLTKLEDEIKSLNTSENDRLSRFEDEIQTLKSSENERFSEFKSALEELPKLKAQIKNLEKTNEDQFSKLTSELEQEFEKLETDLKSSNKTELSEFHDEKIKTLKTSLEEQIIQLKMELEENTKSNKSKAGPGPSEQLQHRVEQLELDMSDLRADVGDRKDEVDLLLSRALNTSSKESKEDSSSTSASTASPTFGVHSDSDVHAKLQAFSTKLEAIRKAQEELPAMRTSLQELPKSLESLKKEINLLSDTVEKIDKKGVKAAHELRLDFDKKLNSVQASASAPKGPGNAQPQATGGHPRSVSESRLHGSSRPVEPSGPFAFAPPGTFKIPEARKKHEEILTELQRVRRSTLSGDEQRKKMLTKVVQLQAHPDKGTTEEDKAIRRELWDWWQNWKGDPADFHANQNWYLR